LTFYKRNNSNNNSNILININDDPSTCLHLHHIFFTARFKCS